MQTRIEWITVFKLWYRSFTDPCETVDLVDTPLILMVMVDNDHNIRCPDEADMMIIDAR